MSALLLSMVALAAPGCNTQACEIRVERRRRAKVVRPYSAMLDRIALRCEVRGRDRPWQTNTNNGYYGGLQFSMSTWKGVGGWSRPDLNSELNQKYRAVLLIRKSGGVPAGLYHWPRCRRFA